MDKRRMRYLFLTVVVILALLFFLASFDILKPLQSGLSYLTNPIQSFFYSSGQRMGQAFSTSPDVSELEKENQALRNQILNLITENTRLKTTIEENQILSEQLAFIETRGLTSTVSAQVIGKSSDNLLQIITLNRGAKDGLIEGLGVIVSDGLLVGKLIEVDTNTSKVLLLTDGHSSISAVIQNETNTPGLVEGEHGLALKMNYIPQNEEVGLEQYIITSGLEKNVPKGLVIGQINKVDKKPGELFQSVLINPLIDFDQIQIVTVIIE